MMLVPVFLALTEHETPEMVRKTDFTLRKRVDKITMD